MTDRGKEKLKGIEKADSVALCPHKSLFMPTPLSLPGLFDTLISQYTDKGRIKRWVVTMVKGGLFEEGHSALSYERVLLVKKAFKNYDKEEFNKRKVLGALLADSFATSNWYQYYLAVMWYKERFFAVCKEQGLAIPR